VISKSESKAPSNPSINFNDLQQLDQKINELAVENGEYIKNKGKKLKLSETSSDRTVNLEDVLNQNYAPLSNLEKQKEVFEKQIKINDYQMLKEKNIELYEAAIPEILIVDD
jgi:flagellar biosynthesis chaperone FliJ